MNAATTASFEELVEDVTGGNTKIQRRDYLPVGEFPIVDQGQDLVGGYWDDANDLVSGNGPWIVFGDHTRALKYLDMPFCLGADGVKVLKPRSEKHLDPKYLYHFLVAHPVRSAGYSRHFKFLKMLTIPLPPLDEQRRIAAILDKMDELRRKRKRALELLEGLTPEIFRSYFRLGDWQTRRLADVVKPGTIVTYGIVQAGPEYEGGVPYIRSGDIVDGRIVSKGLKHTDPAVAAKYKRSRLDAYDIVMSIRATVGTTALVPAELNGANLTQGTARISPGPDVTPLFLLHFLRSTPCQLWLQTQVKGVTFREITLERLRELKVPMPPLDLQNEFERPVLSISRDTRLMTAHLESLEACLYSIREHIFPT